MGQTVVEKIAQSHMAEGPRGRPLRAGDFLSIRPRHVMTHDNTSPVMKKFKAHRRAADPRPAAARLLPRPRHPEHAPRRTWRSTARSRPSRASTAIDFYPAGIGHRPPDHGRAAVRGARLVRRRLGLPLEHVRRRWVRSARPSCAPTPRRSGPPASSGGRSRAPSRSCSTGQLPERRDRQGRDHRAVRPVRRARC